MIDESVLPFLAEKGHVVSLVGGGGKTTLLYAMADCCAKKGWRTLATTTTHILCPGGGRWAQTDARLEALWRSGSYAVAGSAAPAGKLTAPAGQQLADWISRSEAVFVEADGAKHLPCKVPAEHEPVLLPQCDIVLAVAGLSALEKPLEQVCFRLKEACRVLSVTPDTLLTPELLARMLADPQGGRKAVGGRQFYVVLNQADTSRRRMLGEQVLRILQQEYGINGFLTFFQEGERA